MEQPKVVFETQWRGKPLSECSREELIQAIESCGRRIKQLEPFAFAADRLRLGDWYQRRIEP